MALLQLDFLVSHPGQTLVDVLLALLEQLNLFFLGHGSLHQDGFLALMAHVGSRSVAFSSFVVLMGVGGGNSNINHAFSKCGCFVWVSRNFVL